MPCEYEKECEHLSRMACVAYCSGSRYESCPIRNLKRQVRELKAENMLLKTSESSYRERVAKGLERTVEIVKEVQR